MKEERKIVCIPMEATISLQRVGLCIFGREQNVSDPPIHKLCFFFGGSSMKPLPNIDLRVL